MNLGKHYNHVILGAIKIDEAHAPRLLDACASTTSRMRLNYQAHAPQL